MAGLAGVIGGAVRGASGPFGHDSKAARSFFSIAAESKSPSTPKMMLFGYVKRLWNASRSSRVMALIVAYSAVRAYGDVAPYASFAASRAAMACGLSLRRLIDVLACVFARSIFS